MSRRSWLATLGAGGLAATLLGTAILARASIALPPPLATADLFALAGEAT